MQKKHTFDEDDDTSKQATQNYDLNDFEREVRNFPSCFFFYGLETLFFYEGSHLCVKRNIILYMRL